MTTDTAQLKIIRDIHERATPDWQISFDGKGEAISVRDDTDFMADDTDNGHANNDIVLVEIATITALNPADAQLIRCAPEYIGFLIDLFDRAYAEVKRLKQFEPEPKPDKDYTTMCAIACGGEPFIRYLQDQHHLQSTDKEAVAKRVREICNISSRKQLNQSTTKANNWLRLSHDFEGWMRSAELANPS